MTTIQCEICNHKLASFETPPSLPLTGTMFAAPDPWMPPPFAPELDWEWMRCPMCGKRPFTQEGRFLIFDQAGFLDIAEGYHRDPETGMLTGALLDGATMPPVAGVEARTADSPPPPVDPPKGPTVLEEVYRLADAGMKPGQISAELAKAGVVLHHVTIAQKLRARANP